MSFRRWQNCLLYLVVTVLGLFKSPSAKGDNFAQGERTVKDVQQTVIFSAKQYGFACFRIPVLLSPQAGVLLAFVEARYQTCSDDSAHSILLKRSEDGGGTWSGPIVVANVSREETLKAGDGLNLGTAAFAPASTQSGAAPGRVWVTWVECFHKCDVPLQYVSSSEDLGVTWPDANIMNITGDILPVSKFAPGPGYGLYLEKFKRILMCGHYLHSTADRFTVRAADNTDADSFNSSSPITRGSVCIFSDDAGQTWQAGDPVPYNGLDIYPDECQPVDLTNGSLLMSMRDERNSHHPLWALSDDGGKSWQDTHIISDLLTATCDQSLLQMNDTLYLSHPNSITRSNLTIHYTTDGGQSWQVLGDLWRGPAAYSCLAAPSESAIAVLYERGKLSAYETITAAFIPLRS